MHRTPRLAVSARLAARALRQGFALQKRSRCARVPARVLTLYDRTNNSVSTTQTPTSIAPTIERIDAMQVLSGPKRACAA
jgi:hypothetical protein